MSEGDSALSAVVEQVDAQVEQPEVSTEAVETPELESQQPTGDESLPEREQQEERPSSKPDGRMLPKDIQRGLKALRENPETAPLAKALNDAYFRSEAYTKVGSIDEISGWKSQLESLGGQEGIAELQSRAETLSKLDQDFDSGNPAVLDEIAPEGFKKLVAPAIERLERLDPDAYSNALRPHLMRSIESARLPDVLNFMQYLLARNDVAEARNQVKLVQDWLAGQRDAVAQTRQSANDPKLEQLTQREQAISQREMNSFRAETAGHVNGIINKSIEKQVDSLFKDGKGGSLINDGQRKQFARAVIAEATEALKSDKDYMAKLQAAIKSRDGKALVSYANSQLPTLIAKVAQQVRNEMYPTLQAAPAQRLNKQTQKQPSGQRQEAAGQSKWLRLPSRPADGDIDWSKTNMTALIAHKAILRNGKQVTW